MRERTPQIRLGALWLGAFGLAWLGGACASCKTSTGARCGIAAVDGDGGSGGGGSGDGGAAGTSTGGDSGAGAGDRSGGSSGGSSIFAAGVRWLGRVDVTTDPDHPRFGWSGTGFVATFTGGSLAVRLGNTGPFVFKAVVDGQPQPAFAAVTGAGTYTLTGSLEAGPHTVALYRQTEGSFGDSQLLGITVDGGELAPPPAAAGRLIDVIGASVSCGYGDLGTSPCGFSFATESAFDAYESVAARAVGAELSVVAISGRGVYRNADGTTTGTMPLLLDRILATSATPTWDFREAPGAVVINLGKNDLALGDPGPPFAEGYLAFTRALRERYPDALIVCTTGPNLGDAAHALQLAYVAAAVQTRQAEGDGAIELLDWSEETAAEQGCDVHPNAAKHLAMGAELAARLRARLGW